MGVVVWRTRTCQNLKCAKVFYTKEKREDLETFAAAIIDAIVSHEFLSNSQRYPAEKVRAWEAVVRRVLKEYRDE